VGQKDADTPFDLFIKVLRSLITPLVKLFILDCGAALILSLSFEVRSTFPKAALVTLLTIENYWWEDLRTPNMP